MPPPTAIPWPSLETHAESRTAKSLPLARAAMSWTLRGGPKISEVAKISCCHRTLFLSVAGAGAGGATGWIIWSVSQLHAQITLCHLFGGSPCTASGFGESVVSRKTEQQLRPDATDCMSPRYYSVEFFALASATLEHWRCDLVPWSGWWTAWQSICTLPWDWIVSGGWIYSRGSSASCR